MTDKKPIDIQAIVDSVEDGCEVQGTATFNWGLKGFGFGMLHFYMKDGKLHCDNECMKPETVKKILNMMVDQCVMDDS